MVKEKTSSAAKMLKPTAKTAVETTSTYTKEEFAKAAKSVFGVPPECVMAAFSVSGIEKATETEAKQMVERFMNREVK